MRPRDFLPPDEPDPTRALIQQEINAKLEPGCRIYLWAWRRGDSEIQYSALFSYKGQTDETAPQEEMFFDTDRLIKQFNAWRHKVEQKLYLDNWTTVPPEEPDWNQ